MKKAKLYFSPIEKGTLLIVYPHLKLEAWNVKLNKWKYTNKFKKFGEKALNKSLKEINSVLKLEFIGYL